jgi:hypothetical protein
MLKAAKSPLLKNRSRYDPQLLTYVILLRFGTAVNPDFSKPILNYQSIAKLIKKPVTTVIELVKFAILAYNYSFEISPPNRSNTHSNTLGTWSLHPRCKNPLINHWLREHNCFTGDLVNRKYRHPRSIAFT